MNLNFTQQEKDDIRDIIEQYRSVSGELYSYQEKAKEIQEKVIELEKNLKSIKEREDKMMKDLHSRYGEFGIQDIYESVIQCQK